MKYSVNEAKRGIEFKRWLSGVLPLNAMLPQLGGKWETEWLNTRFPTSFSLNNIFLRMCGVQRQMQEKFFNIPTIIYITDGVMGLIRTLGKRGWVPPFSLQSQ